MMKIQHWISPYGRGFPAFSRHVPQCYAPSLVRAIARPYVIGGPARPRRLPCPVEPEKTGDHSEPRENEGEWNMARKGKWQEIKDELKRNQESQKPTSLTEAMKKSRESTQSTNLLSSARRAQKSQQGGGLFGRKGKSA
ncbi:hypothetical protein PWG71_17430 [Nocardiopsis sp. N85]|uniref:hypothetical protein n=1 Tax=Nocardiopsis sp. N85 TaxID=3029400 RepID=UPI00237F2766|nr:hypothetical protein [Nocardiopsis sp. N85]MDE3723177.1 hypothetical protein [Nocardiopsis sp. N85]